MADIILKSPEIQALITTKYHHRNVTVFWFTHNLFMTQKYSRTISLNTQYIILFKNPRDKKQASYLASQIYPRNTSYMMSALEKAHICNYGYLCIDLTPSSYDKYMYRLRTNILPNEDTIVFVPK